TLIHLDTVPFNLTVIPSSGQLHYSVDGGAFLVAPLTQTQAISYTGNIPATPCFSTVRYYISLATDYGVKTDPPGAPAVTYSYEVSSGVGPTPIFADDFESDLGWTAAITRTPGTTLPLSGLWARVVPVGTIGINGPGAPSENHTPAPGTMCFVTEQGMPAESFGAHDIDNGTTTLTSPMFSALGIGDAVIGYWRWFANNIGAAGVVDDVFLVQLSSDNGAN